MVQKIVNYFGADGLLHIVCSAALVSVLGWFAPPWIAALLAFLVGIGKEIVYDKWLKKGTPQWKDVVADLAGIVLGCI